MLAELGDTRSVDSSDSNKDDDLAADEMWESLALSRTRTRTYTFTAAPPVPVEEHAAAGASDAPEPLPPARQRTASVPSVGSVTRASALLRPASSTAGDLSGLAPSIRAPLLAHDYMTRSTSGSINAGTPPPRPSSALEMPSVTGERAGGDSDVAVTVFGESDAKSGAEGPQGGVIGGEITIEVLRATILRESYRQTETTGTVFFSLSFSLSLSLFSISLCLFVNGNVAAQALCSCRCLRRPPTAPSTASTSIGCAR